VSLEELMDLAVGAGEGAGGVFSSRINTNAIWEDATEGERGWEGMGGEASNGYFLVGGSAAMWLGMPLLNISNIKYLSSQTTLTCDLFPLNQPCHPICLACYGR